MPNSKKIIRINNVHSIIRKEHIMKVDQHAVADTAKIMRVQKAYQSNEQKKKGVQNYKVVLAM